MCRIMIRPGFWSLRWTAEESTTPMIPCLPTETGQMGDGSFRLMTVPLFLGKSQKTVPRWGESPGRAVPILPGLTICSRSVSIGLRILSPPGWTEPILITQWRIQSPLGLIKSLLLWEAVKAHRKQSVGKWRRFFTSNPFPPLIVPSWKATLPTSGEFPVVYRQHTLTRQPPPPDRFPSPQSVWVPRR